MSHHFVDHLGPLSGDSEVESEAGLAFGEEGRGTAHGGIR